jgi:hypothetical protein
VARSSRSRAANQRSRACVWHQRQRRLNDRERADYVRLEICPRLFNCCFLKCAHKRVTGIAQHDVQAAETTVGLIDCSGHSVVGRHIELQGKNRITILSGQWRKRLQVAGRRRNPISAL